MELNVFIIDDDINITDQLSKTISSWAIRKNYIVNTVIRNDLNEVTSAIVAPFDLVILDIRIGPYDGIAFAKELRAIGSDAMIAFISNFEQYAINGYSVHAVSYLLKPLDDSAIESLLEESITLVGDFSSKSIRISQNGLTRFVSIRSILYAEALSKRIILHLLDKEESFYMTINELTSQLTGTTLIRCHRSYIVNLEYVRVFTTNNLYLYNVDTPIPIGRSYITDLKERLFHKRSNHIR